ncbi:zinc finger CCCH domain-containing protein 18 [Phtheirospermum japonicum]|uniref:Zinc finger CCCH domain-containing protein 18 n=1 Tax=Phtheirospermum japonicum TaxID=374723 RepID=A0A830BUR9_9LAMI|nr:zinc finger CCCH domain-containing protein 18 [Phtheirospermum japonicum]
MKSGPLGFPNDYYCPEAGFNSIRGCRNSPSLIMDYPVKTCHYFNKGFCKHGSNCRFYHGESFPESYHQMFGGGPNLYEDDQLFSPGSLEKLELEITELLKSRRGYPVSIASLPMLYYEKYGRTLQAEGYLTESQRHGKAGYSLTKLLARLKNSIRLIDRPHGQHAVILSEDAPKYMDIRGERNDPGPIVNGSRQIYLTFPAESTFNEEDVSSYFSTFGPVQDVRIPCQQKRMFGFVTFVSADTVKLILSKGNPHYVCGARVLVKPYREKSKLVERKYLEKFDHPVYYHHTHPIDVDSELQTSWESSRLFRRQQLMEEHEHYAMEQGTMRLSQLQLGRKSVPTQSCLGYSMDELKVPQGPLHLLLLLLLWNFFFCLPV